MSTDTKCRQRSPLFDLEEPLRDVQCGVDVILLLSEGVRQCFLEPKRAGEALYYIAGHVETAAKQAEEAFDKAFALHVSSQGDEQ